MSTKGVRSKRNTALLGISAVILLLIVGLAYRESRQYGLANARAAQTREILSSVDKLLIALFDAEMGQRGFLLTGENQYLEPYSQAIKIIPVELRKLSDLLASRPNESSNVAKLNGLVDEKLSEFRETIALAQAQSVSP